MGQAMNASPTEVTLILAAIEKVDAKVDKLDTKVETMDTRINGRIRKLERFRWQLVGAGALGVIALNVALRFL